MTDDCTIRDFFISYAQEDLAWAKWINERLEKAGYSTILPPRDFRPGSNFPLEMDRAVRARRMLAILSPDYLASSFTQPEWAAVFRTDPTGEKKKLVPVRIAPCDVQGMLASLIYIDLVKVADQPEKAERILLAGLREAPKASKAAPFPDTQPVQSAMQEQTRARFGKPFPAYWNVPRRPASYFAGRDQEIELLDKRFAVRASTQIVPFQALVGLGGMGKTQMAAEYAFRYRERYKAVLWARADSKENLQTDFLAFQRLLGLNGTKNPVETMQAWFNSQTEWLLILDNADDLHLAEPFLPLAPHGHVLLTTRVRASGDIADPLLLEPLIPEDGALCLLRRTGKVSPEGLLSEAKSADDVEASLALSELMEGLPLALEQAGAYIDDTGNAIKRYLKLYETRRAEIIQRHYGALPNYPLTVATAWEFARKTVQYKEPAAYELLQLCAFLAPDAIDEDLFLKGASALGARLGPLAADPLTLDAITIILRRYSLLNREFKDREKFPRYSIHRVMQEILCDEMNEETRQLWASRAAQATLQARSFLERPVVRVHLQYCLAQVSKWQILLPEADDLRRFLDDEDA